MFEFDKSSKGFSPKEEVSLSSDLEGKVTMKTVKLGPMRLKLSEASELTESSIRLSPMGEVSGASDFKGKEVMQVRQLTRVNAKTVGKAKPSIVNQEDSIRVKLKCGQESDITSCHQDVQISRTCHLEVATRALREWMGENVTGRSSKQVTIHQMHPMEVYCLDGDHLAHKNWPDLRSCWRSLSD
ncbi:hypothetical protein Gogos_021429 [Gossypium gossypioides]|uniref:Uncharacterized protein n=1 Tax=Gossypium gossypioides TaxID=34282 RepID=A0A7J9D7N7_GOSGO|nr:hypothetical protein [Gossypium gossypioides]